MSDAKYFSRGKVQEFQDELRALKKDNSKNFKLTKKILKKIVANITMGNDMSALAVEMISLLSIPDFEVKKMVYLFIVSYSSKFQDIAEAAIPSLTNVFYVLEMVSDLYFYCRTRKMRILLSEF